MGLNPGLVDVEALHKYYLECIFHQILVLLEVTVK
jgi:hypothetical protein